MHKTNGMYAHALEDGTIVVCCSTKNHEGGVVIHPKTIGRWKPLECMIEGDTARIKTPLQKFDKTFDPVTINRIYSEYKLLAEQIGGGEETKQHTKERAALTKAHEKVLAAWRTTHDRAMKAWARDSKTWAREMKTWTKQVITHDKNTKKMQDMLEKGVDTSNMNIDVLGEAPIEPPQPAQTPEPIQEEKPITASTAQSTNPGDFAVLKQMRELELQMKEYYNHYFAFVNSTKSEILQMFYDDKGRVIDFMRSSIQSAVERTSNAWWSGGLGDTPAFNKWLGWDKRRSYNKIVFKPSGTVLPGEFNTFMGLRVEMVFDITSPDFDLTEANMEKIKLRLKHLREVLADNNPDVFDYLLKWLKVVLVAKLKSKVALVFIGGQGTGKGSFWDEFLGQKLVGGDEDGRCNGPYSQIGDIDKIVGRFNTLGIGRLLINGDECSSFGGAYKQNNALKRILTERVNQWEQKGVDAITVRDFANYIFTTNNPHPVKVEADDRHFLVLKVGNKYKQNKDYFVALMNEVAIEGSEAIFMRYLMERVDITSFSPEHNLVMTDAKRTLIAHEVPSSVRFLQQALEDGKAELPPDGMIESEVSMVKFELYRAYEYWTRINSVGADKKESADAFAKHIIGDLLVKGTREKGRKGTRVRGFKFDKDTVLKAIEKNGWQVKDAYSK